ncbi:hypothetical protein CDL15_Pgr002598 [Punica granatum]|uniref:Uncharacterized protein n=1 Tax=Punica granatum TaxID=22663 RepID=A0A218WW96_PUNGR|nr:hypothetical protein CDL15_Pgr002598 [Punica granatum]
MAAAAVSGEWLGTRALGMARCRVELVGLLRGGSRRARVDPSVPRPEQTRKCETMFGKKRVRPGKRETPRQARKT